MITNIAYKHLIENRKTLADIEKDAILFALKKHDNKRRWAACELDISERTLYRKINLYKIEIPND